MAFNVVALISGGKDSMFSMLHCSHLGHKVVALANLYPPETSPIDHEDNHEPDLNSFMFQSVGHTIIPLYAEALGLPLYRQEIHGTAKHTSKEYDPAAVAGDETEDIFVLLCNVKKAHPEVNAVSTGAILSTYQRTRVESVALRLGLTPLGWLWQYPELPFPDRSPTALLRHMGSLRLDARIIKVASGGLDESFLWQNLCEEKTIRRVQKAVDRFGGSVLGEGGEFETLVLSGPAPLWKGRIEIKDKAMVIQKGGGGEAFVSFKAGSVLPLSASEQKNVVAPVPLLDEFTQLLLASDSLSSLCSQERPSNKSISSSAASSQIPVTSSTMQSGPFHYFNNICCPNEVSKQGADGDTATGQTVQDQPSYGPCMRLRELLHSHDLDSSNIVHTTVLLRSMSVFAEFNHAYGQLFPRSLPPSRVTVACGDNLPPGINTIISAVAFSDATARKGLHVQTRSHWAPANIGPYSQARTVSLNSSHSAVFVAGQIPLVPATMEMYEPLQKNASLNFAHAAALSLQHLWRIGLEQHVGYWSGAVAYIAPSGDFVHRAKIARQIWFGAHNASPSSAGDDEEIDVWDKRNLNAQSWALPDELIRPLPDVERRGGKGTVPGFLAVEIAQLPRDAPIEWQSVGFTSSLETARYIVTDADCRNGFKTTSVGLGNKMYADGSRGGDSSITYAELRPGTADQNACSEFVSQRCGGLQVTFYATSQALPWLATLSESNPCQIIPCQRVQGSDGDDLLAGMIVQELVQERGLGQPE